VNRIIFPGESKKGVGGVGDTSNFFWRKTLSGGAGSGRFLVAFASGVFAAVLRRFKEHGEGIPLPAFRVALRLFVDVFQ
jgi:hypothetical protein